MASLRVKQILISKEAPFTPEEIDAMTERAAWAWIYEHFPPKQKQDRNPENLAEIHFTGFSDSEKTELHNIARARFFVSKSVTSKLKFLVAGPNAGPSKLTKARTQNVTILTEEQFYSLMEHGELPT